MAEKKKAVVPEIIDNVEALEGQDLLRGSYGSQQAAYPAG